jgi:hypothetical protein
LKIASILQAKFVNIEEDKEIDSLIPQHSTATKPHTKPEATNFLKETPTPVYYIDEHDKELGFK